MGAGTKVGSIRIPFHEVAEKKGFQRIPADSGDSALFLCQRNLVRWIEKNLDEKNGLKQIATWVKSQLGLVPLDPYYNPYLIWVKSQLGLVPLDPYCNTKGTLHGHK